MRPRPRSFSPRQRRAFLKDINFLLTKTFPNLPSVSVVFFLHTYNQYSIQFKDSELVQKILLQLSSLNRLYLGFITSRDLMSVRSEPLIPLLRNLSCLELAISTETRPTSDRLDFPPGSQVTDAIFKALLAWLSYSKNLNILRLHASHFDLTAFPFRDVSDLNPLSELVFEGFSLTVDSLVTFLKRHEKSLRTLVLSHVAISSGTWRQVFNCLAGFQNLKNFRLEMCTYYSSDHSKPPQPLLSEDTLELAIVESNINSIRQRAGLSKATIYSSQ